MQYQDFTHGLAGLHSGPEDDLGGDVLIHFNAEFWGLPQDQQIALLYQARENTIFLGDLWLLYYFNGHDHEVYARMQADPSIATRIEAVETNPYASEKQKNEARSLLACYREYCEKKDFRRQPGKGNLRHQIITRDKGFCRYCTKEANPITIDHIIPYSLGGKTELSNLVVACKSCNSRKRDRTPEQAGMVLLEVPV